MTTVVHEEFAAADHDVNGKGSSFPDPVDTGSTARPQDNTGNTEADIAHAPGVGDVPRAAVLKALMAKLAGLPADVLAKIANDFDANADVNENPSGATDGEQVPNLASILSVKEDMEELFAGEELSEDFKAKATVIFEAAVGARVALIEAELTDKLTEEKNAEVAAAAEQITEEIVDKMDRYLSYAAEEFVTENKVEIEGNIQKVVSENLLEDVLALASKYNIKVKEQEIDVVEDLTNQVTELRAQLNEQTEKAVVSSERVRELEIQQSFSELTAGLTATQRERVSQLAENVEYESVDDYRSKVGILCETVNRSVNEKKSPSALITEAPAVDGVPLINENVEGEVVTQDETVRGTLSALKRFK